MKPIAAGVAGALISGVAMYAVGAKAAQVETPVQSHAFVQTADGQFVPASYTTSLRPAASPPAASTRSASTPAPSASIPVRTASRRTASSAAPGPAREAVVDEVRSERSWGKTAMIVGGSTASGAGVGGIIGGKKGALIGAAIGGGAASIYEANRRR